MIPRRRCAAERRIIYSEIRSRNLDDDVARRLRDWTKDHINTFLRERNIQEIDIKLSPIYLLDAVEMLQSMEGELIQKF